MDMSGEGGAGAGAGAGALQQRWYDGRVNGSPAAGDVGDANADGFFHSPLEGGHHSRARYYHQQMHAPYSAAVGSHEIQKALHLPNAVCHYVWWYAWKCVHRCVEMRVCVLVPQIGAIKSGAEPAPAHAGTSPPGPHRAVPSCKNNDAMNH
ncbi:hypothetical protein RR46_08580 [Papilio xuthus]|uniref:Uncharacterized protein n=1 Tax=Papilio xuthus TaxID=66420 RepID=A0A194Q7P5_PAPXU|nr:hypothetical protein RR46_08580 [Papilio xuthus]